MSDYKVDFTSMSWESPAVGVKEKAFIKDGQKIRLVRFEEDFVEHNWCVKGHVGYVLDGQMTINFNGKTISYLKGEALLIEEGEVNKHKAMIDKGKFVELILFEAV